MEIDVFGRTYEIKVCKLKKGTYGDCDVEKKVIRINKDKGDPSETLIHEVLHAIFHESGVKPLLEHTEGLEEAIVRAIENGLRSAQLIPEVDFDRLGTNNRMGGD